jgi:serine/threonine protein kinase
VPGTLFFQSPEQETNTFESSSTSPRARPRVEFFEDFYIDIYENDTSRCSTARALPIVGADRTRKKILLNRPFAEPSEINVRGRVVKSVGRPADIYSLGALFYYLDLRRLRQPEEPVDAFRKFVEYDKRDETNTVAAYIDHEYRTIQNLRAPKVDGQGVELAPEDRFFSYKHYLDGNGELIDPMIMLIIAKAMIRNKPDSYCLSWDLRTTGISQMVHDLLVALRPLRRRPVGAHRVRQRDVHGAEEVGCDAARVRQILQEVAWALSRSRFASPRPWARSTRPRGPHPASTSSCAPISGRRSSR